ncbi:hypothetical protein GTA26_26240 [Rhodococcus hoagii]|nr:hypothetical protein [Prescottella equi]
MARFKAYRRALGLQRTARIAREALSELSAAQHADQAPDSMVMDGRALPGAPHEADHREALA